MNRPVKLQNHFTAGGLVKAVYILCDDAAAFAAAFQLSQRKMRFSRLCVGEQHFFPVKFIKQLRIALKAGSAENFLGGIAFKRGAVQPACAAKIRYSAFRRNARSSEKHKIFAFFDRARQRFIHIRNSPLK